MLFTFGLCSSGAVGYNLSDCTTSLEQVSPRVVPMYNLSTGWNYTVADVGVGDGHTIVLADGVLFGMGSCGLGQYGVSCLVNSTLNYSPQRVPVIPPGTITAVYASGAASALLAGECTVLSCLVSCSYSHCRLCVFRHRRAAVDVRRLLKLHPDALSCDELCVLA